MKYPKIVYEQTEFYSPDEEIENHVQKIVKVRTSHDCCQCQSVISPGDMSRLETCFMDGPKRAYTCIACCDKWIDHISGYNKNDVS